MPRTEAFASVPETVEHDILFARTDDTGTNANTRASPASQTPNTADAADKRANIRAVAAADVPRTETFDTFVAALNTF